MNFLVTVRAAGRVIASYPGIGDPFALHAAAVDRYFPCTISVMRSV